MARIFAEFPKKAMCPICGSDKKGKCFLMGIDGTSNDGIEQAIPTHLSCLTALAPLFRYSSLFGVMYAQILKIPGKDVLWTEPINEADKWSD